MFYKVGWKPLREVTKEVFELVTRQYAENTSEWEGEGEDRRSFLVQSDTCDMIYWLLSETEVACMVGTGAVQVSSELLEPIRNCDWENDHIDLRSGTIGSGDWHRNQANGPRTTDRELRRRYGPFLFAPVVVKEKGFNVFLQKNGAPVRRGGKMNASKIRDELIRMFDEGKFDTRTAALELIGKDCRSRNQFSEGWAGARAMRPKMGRPGRRKLL
jgi:hypothetical protein